MDGSKLSIPFCLRAIADNLENFGAFFIRVGACLLNYDSVGDCYEVIDKDGKTKNFVDLIAAINHFIAVVDLL